MDPRRRFAALVGDPSVPVEMLAALIGAAFDPAADVDAVAYRFDELASRSGSAFDDLLGTLFGSGLLVGNRADYADPRNSYLHRVLERGLGIPITLSVCAVAVGRRIGLDIEMVGLPGHVVVRCEEHYGDPFNGGRRIAAEDLETEWRRMTGIDRPLGPDLLDAMTPRAVALRMLNNLRQTLTAIGDPTALAVLASLRNSFPELASERQERARWVRHWN